MDKWNGRFNKSQRIQMKVFICVLGLGLLFILLLGKIIFPLLHKDWKWGEESHVPVIEVLTNVWVMEADEEKLLIFRDGVEETYYIEKNDVNENQEDDAEETIQKDKEISWKNAREQVADITLTDGRVSSIVIKTEKLNGKILSADTEGVEVEGYGKLPLATDYKGYRIYNTLEMCTAADLHFGYNFADLVVEDGAICAILLAKEEAMEYIRVLIKASDYSALLHNEVVLSADSDFTIQYGSYDNVQTENHVAGEEVVIGRDSAYLATGRVSIWPNVITGKIVLKSVNRNQGVPSYRGHMELINTGEGIAVINEVSLEEYLYSVVPSEMPSSYSEEALKAQAICARTYAYGHMLHAGYPQYGAHVDDSTSYQVYNNILEQESTTTAVKETYGQLLFTEEGTLAGTYYYSTSCGVGSDAQVWKTEEARSITYLRAKDINQNIMQAEIAGENAMALLNEGVDLGEALREESAFSEFIKTSNEMDFEASEAWYRWNYQVEEIDTECLLGILQKRFAANEKLVLTLKNDEFVSEPIEELNEIIELYVEKRGAGGVADELIIRTKEHTYKVISEHNIRYVLNNGESKIIRQDGSEIESPNLLPSGFFVIEAKKEGERITGYTLTGGGFGHGVGMSQNGAKNMALKGYNAEQILLFFYEKCCIKNVYE